MKNLFIRKTISLIIPGLFTGLSAIHAHAGIVNGTFENGTTGWTLTTAGGANPIGVSTSYGQLGASLTNDHYAYTSQSGPGYSILSQAFTTQTGTIKLFFDVAIKNNSAGFYNPDTLNYAGAPNQQARFDILKPGASVTSIDPNDIIVTAYKTETGQPTTQAWSTKTIDLTSVLSSYVGQDVILRFWQVDNQGIFNLALDNINVGLSQLGLSVSAATTSLRNTPAGNAATIIDANSDLLNLFSELASEAELSNAASQTLPLLTGGSMAAAGNALSGINKVIQARIESNRGLSAGDGFFGDKYVWVKPFGSWADQDDQQGVSGFKSTTTGVAFGVDSAVNDKLRLGTAMAYAKADVDSNSNVAKQSADVDVFQLVGYGSYSLGNNSEVNFQVDVGQNSNKGRRSIAFTSSTATSEYTSYTAHAGAGLGRTYQLSAATSITPSIRADYTWIKDKAYQESGAGLLNLNVGSRDSEELVLGLDGKISHQLSDNTSLSANLGVGYDTMAKRSSITATFAGAPGAAFTTYGLEAEPWSARAGVGLTHTTANGTEITLRYDAEHREAFLNQTASLKARWAF